MRGGVLLSAKMGSVIEAIWPLEPDVP
jgi:hypothetical protein